MSNIESYIVASGDPMDECDLFILGSSRQELELILSNLELDDVYEVRVYNGVIVKGQAILNNPESLDVFWMYITDAEQCTGIIGDTIGATPEDVMSTLNQVIELPEDYGIEDFDIDNLKLIYGYKVNCHLTVKNDYLNKLGSKACKKFADFIMKGI